MSFGELEPILGPAGRLTLAAGPSGRREINELTDAVYSVYRVTSSATIGLTQFLSASGSRPSGIPPMIHRSLDQTMQKLRLVLLERPPNQLSTSPISQGDKAKLFALLAEAIDAVRELYDNTDPARQFGGIDYGTTWAKMETCFVMDEVRELLYSIAGSSGPRQPAYPYGDITSPTGIRLLVIHPDDDPESIIRCSLLYETDYSKRGYAALSYVWGEPADPPPTIILDGISFPVTPNLHVALKHFRHAARRRVLWVDALCINQSNPAEKSQQISQMDQIYRSSVCVLMWIGDAGSDGRFALQWLRELQDARTQGLRAIHEAQMQGLDEDQDDYRLHDLDRACHNDTIRNHWPAIRAFFLRTYWRRVWILQEVIAKEDSLICYGAYGIPWSFVRHLALVRLEDMQEALSFRFGRGVLPNADTVALELGAAFRCLKFHADFTEMRVRGLPIPFLRALLASRACKASDRRDHIYAVMGFVSDCPVRPDCSKHVYQVYLETARDVIRQTGKLDFLTACKCWSPERREWERQAVVDLGGSNENRVWALIRRVLPPHTALETMTVGKVDLLLRAAKNPQFQLPRGDDYRKALTDHLEKLGTACLPSWVPQWHWTATEPYLLLDGGDRPPFMALEGTRRFNASGGTTAQCTFRNGDTALSLSGVEVDVVRSVKLFPNTGWDAMSGAWELWTRESPTTPRYPTRESRQDAFYRTCMRLDAANGERHRDWNNSSHDVQWTLFKLEMGWGDLSQLSRATADIMDGDGAQAVKYVERAEKNIKNQAFFTCQGGRIGVGPLAVQSGDLVCVLKGGDVPFVLRWVSGGCYYLMGEAFVDGIMNGEAMVSGHWQVYCSNFTLV